MPSTAVVTVCIGLKYQEIAEVTHPTIRDYADRIGSDFLVLDRDESQILPHFAKMQINDLLDGYDRILYLDTDLIVRADCPNLFELVPESDFGVFREGSFMPRRKTDLEIAARTYRTRINLDPTKWQGQYWNTGVMVASRCHKDVFVAPERSQILKGGLDFGEQGWINIQLINKSIPIKDLDYRFNRMTVMDPFTGIHRLDSYIVHYAGAPEVMISHGEKVPLQEFIRRDIYKWGEDAPHYGYKRNILITVGGGLGDQVDAEPVVRYIKEIAYPEANIQVISDWPRIFSHLEIPCDMRHRLKLTEDTPYYEMETLPIPESHFGSTISHPLVHSTDYSSISCLRRTLPNRDKHIHLQVTDQDRNKLERLARGFPIEDSVAIHPGIGWSSKTIPTRFWTEITDLLIGESVPVCLIGKHISDDQGVDDFSCPDALDLRDLTDLGSLLALLERCPVLLSNDSAPIHLAGSFNNHIAVIPTCKHPDHILPWRNGTQAYKTSSHYKKLLCEDIPSLPTELDGQTVDWIPGGDISKYLPDPKSVTSSLLGVLRSRNT